MSPSFLLIGLGMDELEKIVPKEQYEQTKSRILAGIAQGEKEITDKGYGCKLINYGPEESMDKLKGALGEKQYDGVCIGFGIRSYPQYTALFENLVNTISEDSPRSKLLFNTTPTSTMEAIQRWFL